MKNKIVQMEIKQNKSEQDIKPNFTKKEGPNSYLTTCPKDHGQSYLYFVLPSQIFQNILR